MTVEMGYNLVVPKWYDEIRKAKCFDAERSGKTEKDYFWGGFTIMSVQQAVIAPHREGPGCT